jgi:hypothetical protein
MLTNTVSLTAARASALVRNSESGRAKAGKRKEKIQSGDKLAFTIDEAVQSSSLGQTSIYQAIKEKRLIMRKYGSRSVITRGDLVAFLNGLPISG